MKMATTTEDQTPSSNNGSNSNQTSTKYDQYQAELASQSQDKTSKGKSSRKKDKKQDAPAAGAAPSAAAPEDPNQHADQNDSGVQSSPLKKTKEKKYEAPRAMRGFKKDVMSLEIMLLQDGRAGSSKTIGVVGQRSVGKTTLCRTIMKNERVTESYRKMFWITLSEVPGIQTTGPEDMEGTVELVSDVEGVSTKLDVHNQKLKEEKCLIVFDDLGEAEEDEYYQKLKNCFNGVPKENGGAIIVTCRSEEAAKKLVGDENLHRLQPLNDPDSCWRIYNDAVRDKETEKDDTVSKEVKEELLKRCGGLPWVARMMGKIKAQQLADDKNKPNQNNNTPIP